MILNLKQYKIYQEIADQLEEFGYISAIDLMTSKVKKQEISSEDCAAVLKQLLLIV